MSETEDSPQNDCDKLLDDNAILMACLQQLVDLKDYKDEHGKDKYYNKNQPIAWDYAKSVLKDVMK